MSEDVEERREKRKAEMGDLIQQTGSKRKWREIEKTRVTEGESDTNRGRDRLIDKESFSLGGAVW